MSDDDARLVWMDLEMTGLKPEQDVIIEIATIVTDASLRVIAEGPMLAIHHPPAVLERMDEWNRTTHDRSGLIERVRTSQVDTAEAERRTLEFIKGHAAPQTAPLCGNSIHQDRRFLARYMRELDDYLHYRIIDVSSVKELARRWRPDVADAVRKDSRHEARADVLDSIAELRHYRDRLFRLDPAG